jgi:AcrR family transcriptional regulator
MPVQARATVTVDAICEATIQVLLSHGAERLTTTRVAERAGVSIGTLYQYYPNKQSLLFALLTQHLDQISAAVEVACAQARGKPLAEMVQHVVEQFVDAKMRRADISMALYRISAELGGPALAKRTEDRSRKALEAMIKTAPDATSQPEAFAIQMMFSAMAGATRTVLEAGAPPIMVRKLREHLVLLCRCYLGALASARPRD